MHDRIRSASAWDPRGGSPEPGPGYHDFDSCERRDICAAFQNSRETEDRTDSDRYACLPIIRAPADDGRSRPRLKIAVQGSGIRGAARRIPLRVEPLSLGHQEVAELPEEAEVCEAATGGHITVHNRSAIAWNIP